MRILLTPFGSLTLIYILHCPCPPLPALSPHFSEALQRLHVRRPRSATQFLRCHEAVRSERAVESTGGVTVS